MFMKIKFRGQTINSNFQPSPGLFCCSSPYTNHGFRGEATLLNEQVLPIQLRASKST